MTSTARIVVVGNGKMASEILRLVDRSPGALAAGAIGDPSQEAAQSRLTETCKQLGVPYLETKNINDPIILKRIRDLRPTYLVSANNFQIFREYSIKAADRGIINFHNGPLPRYGGLNACSWAIFNGEREHGVTWHLVDTGIDSGPILAQRTFPISDNERAISLITKCIQEGISLFEGLLPSLVVGAAKSTPQPREHRLYYGAGSRPFDGYLPWWEGSEVLDRLARGLSFHPLPNIYYRPSLGVRGFPLVYSGEFTVRGRTVGQAGRVLVEPDQFRIVTADASIEIEALYDGDGQEISPQELGGRFGIVEGANLLLP